MTADRFVDELERELAVRSWWLTQPLPAECLVCYLDRMVGEFGCTGGIWTRHFRLERAPRATRLEARLTAMGAHCDCDVLRTVYEPQPWMLVDPSRPRPGLCIELNAGDSPDTGDPGDPGDTGDVIVLNVPCRGVRTGSTQPCTKWRRSPFSPDGRG